MWWMMLLVATLDSVTSSLHSHTSSAPCEEARFKCAQREGCGMALENYLTGCSAVLQGYMIHRCPDVCKDALIALTSTSEGKALMACDCSDKYCDEMKSRVEICRPQVMRASLNDSVVSCHVAQMICLADASCATAFDYYEHYCRSMFDGKKCTKRCRNSIDILGRQEKSAKLRTCSCEATSKYAIVQRNMEKLCHHKQKKNRNKNKRKKVKHPSVSTRRTSTTTSESPIVPIITGDTNTNDFKPTIPVGAKGGSAKCSSGVATVVVVAVLALLST